VLSPARVVSAGLVVFLVEQVFWISDRSGEYPRLVEAVVPRRPVFEMESDRQNIGTANTRQR